MKKCLCILLTLFLSYNAFGDTYYIATNGNDSYSGTLIQPWKTWQKAFIMAQAGDTVFFRGGVYDVKESRDTWDHTRS